MYKRQFPYTLKSLSEIQFKLKNFENACKLYSAISLLTPYGDIGLGCDFSDIGTYVEFPYTAADDEKIRPFTLVLTQLFATLDVHSIIISEDVLGS